MWHFPLTSVSIKTLIMVNVSLSLWHTEPRALCQQPWRRLFCWAGLIFTQQHISSWERLRNKIHQLNMISVSFSLSLSFLFCHVFFTLSFLHLCSLCSLLLQFALFPYSLRFCFITQRQLRYSSNKEVSCWTQSFLHHVAADQVL